MTKTYFDHISETIKARHLIFGIGNPWGLENEMVQSGHKAVPPPHYEATYKSETVILTIH